MSVRTSRLSLYKRSNHVYYVGYYLNGHRRWKSMGVTTRPEALKALESFASLLSRAKRTVQVDQFAEEFLAYALVQNAPRTVTLFRNILRCFRQEIGNISLDEITSEQIDKYKTMRLGRVKPVSVNVELRMLKSAFSAAVRWKLIPENPCKGVQFARIPEQAPVFMSPGDFEKLIKTISEPWFRELVVFAVVTGLRRGEISNLQWGNVDLERRIIQVQSDVRFKTKQGRRRNVPLNSTALEILKSRQQNGVEGYVFTFNGKRISCDWITHLFKRYVRKACLPDSRIHFHSVRHSFASWLVQSGATLYEVQRLLGHSSSKVTEIYSHLQPEQLHSTVNKIQISLN